MDIRRIAEEIGLFETAINLTHVLDSQAVTERVEMVMPPPSPDLAQRLEPLGRWLGSFGKDKYLFLTPELALLDGLDRAGTGGEAILLLPCDMEPDSRARLGGNLPAGREVSLMEEPYFPECFYPGNGLLVVCGYLSGGRTIVLEQTYRMLEHYSNFWGKKLFLPYTRLAEVRRCPGWLEVDRWQFHEIWGGEA